MKKIHHSKDYPECLALYLKDIAKEKHLSTEEEALLASRIKTGDKRSLKKLIKANLKFAISVAKKYEHQGLSLEDLISVSNMGLIEAATKFDASRNYRFITYAVWWIRQAILIALANQSRIVRIPNNLIYDIKKYRDTEDKITSYSYSKADIKDIARDLGITYARASLISGLNMHPVRLDDPVCDNNEEFCLIDLFPSESDEDDKKERDLKNQIEQALGYLKSKREKDIIIQYYGLDNGKPCSLKDLSEKLNLTRERIRQIKESALQKMRKSKVFINVDNCASVA